MKTFKLIRDCFNILEKLDRIKLFIVFLFSLLLAFLDLAAIAMMGILGSLTVYGLQSIPPSTLVQRFLNLIQVSDLSFQMQVVVIEIGRAHV